LKVVDYTRIAETYDDLPIRRDVPPDAWIAASSGRVRVLDVGCGTGSWLAAQRAAFGERVELAGIDPSDAMLARARSKTPTIDLRVASAESLPFADGSFDYVVSRFAFHHFTDKPRALDELNRVIAPGGALHLMNIAPERMPGWWVFQYFPEARAESARYWSATRIAEECEKRGLRAELSIEERRSNVTISDALAQARTRDQSHLVAIDDEAWLRGVQRLEADPRESVPSEVAVMRLVCRR
jgi:ubiquinone/menaquinone biosynthesis C-methylase UbiE